MRAVLLTFALCLAATTAAAQQQVELRPIDRATVRVIGLSGVDSIAGPGRATGVQRVGANPVMGHGSGVAVGPRLVLTARHVVYGMTAWAVAPPGERDPIPARPIYVDLASDVAFVEVDRDLPHFVELPEERPLAMGERVSASGYPLDLREPNPAAASGEVSRVTRDGLLHLTMTVNPGHSGGPVIDEQGRVIAILSMRGRPERGVEGLAIAVPLAMLRRARAAVPERGEGFLAYEPDLARALGLLAVLRDEMLDQRRAEVQGLVERAAATSLIPEHQVVFAALAWNTVLAVLESAGVSEAAQIPADLRPVASQLHRHAVTMARAAVRAAPYLRRRFPVLRPIAIGRTTPFGAARR